MIHLSRVGLAIAVCCLLPGNLRSQTIGDSMVAFLNGNVGTMVGGGRTTHVATESLRIAGGEFYSGDLGVDSPNWGDRVWGTLVTVISYSNGTLTDSAPNAAVLPGDVIQYCGGVTLGTTNYPPHFTSVVGTVSTDAASRPTTVYQQNFGGAKLVQFSTIDTTTLTAGSLQIYRPIPRTDAPNQWKFTVVNNSSTAQTYWVMVGITIVSEVFSPAGTLQSQKVETDGTVPAVVDDIASIYVQNAKGNEIYGSPIAVRQLTP